MPWQHTLQHKLSLTGVGLHSGLPAQCELLPQVANTGIVFVRTDVPGNPEIPATVAHLHATTLATSLSVQHGGREVLVGTVEHLLCALRSLGVDNVRVLIDGPEVPVLDGSALPWVTAITQAGTEVQHVLRTYLRIRKEVRVQAGHKWAVFRPHTGLRIDCALDFDHPLIAATPYRYEACAERFIADIAPARTFCFRADIDALKARGFARGGSLDNAIVIDGYQVLNKEGLRFADECVRHKVLDALGDLALLGAPVLGRLQLYCSGHALNTDLVRATLADAQAFERVTLPAVAQTDDQAYAGGREAHGFGGLAQGGMAQKSLA